MARLSTLAQLPAILNAAEQWRNECLLGDGSVFSNSALWTTPNLAKLDEHFIQNPIEGEEKFLDKFRQQLEPTPGSVKQLAAELLWLLFLFPSNITGSKKRFNIMDVWSWSGASLDASQPLLVLLDKGVGAAGTAYNNFRYRELAFAIRAAQRWKEVPSPENSALIEDPWTFGNWLDGTPDAENRQIRHMLLFLLFPDSYERVASGRQKKIIAAALGTLAGPAENSLVIVERDSRQVILDKQLLSIRGVLEQQHPGQEIDFYTPPIDTMWQKPEDKDTDTGDEAGAEYETEPRIWIEKTLVRGRADREQGEHRLGVALWSPQRAKKGADIYRNMRAVREGDVVLHLIDNKQFSGVSVAAGSADDTFQGLPNTAWPGPAYRVP